MNVQSARSITAQATPPWQSVEDCTAAILDALPVAVVMTGTDGIIRTANRRAAEMFGHAMQEMPGRALTRLVSQRCRAQMDLPRPVLRQAGSSETIADREVFGLHSNGSEFPLKIAVGPTGVGGQPGWLAVLTDLTVQRDSERAQAIRRSALEQANEKLDEFADTVSHDLKAPLRAIAHLAEWIDDDLAPTASETTRENLALLTSRVTRLQTLLDGLLRYARTGHTPEAEVEDVNIAAVVQDIASMLEVPDRFAITCTGSVPVVRTQCAPIRTVLENLIGNAIRHHDRRAGHVIVQVRKSGEIAEFRVADDGPGIPPRHHERVFRVFRTAAGRDDSETSGVGLTIVKKQVQRHGGRIRIDSNPPKRGTTFVFTWKEGAPSPAAW